MPIKYLLLVNKQGQTRISKYYESVSVENRVAMEADIIRKCLGRSDTQVRPAPLLSWYFDKNTHYLRIRTSSHVKYEVVALQYE